MARIQSPFPIHVKGSSVDKCSHSKRVVTCAIVIILKMLKLRNIHDSCFTCGLEQFTVILLSRVHRKTIVKVTDKFIRTKQRTFSPSSNSFANPTHQKSSRLSGTNYSSFVVILCSRTSRMTYWTLQTKL